MLDFSFVLEFAIVGLSLLIGSLLVLVYNRLAERWAWLDALDAEDVVDEYLGMAVEYINSHAGVLAKRYGQVDLGLSEMVEEIASYMLKHAPIACEKAGLNHGTLRDYIMARIE